MNSVRSSQPQPVPGGRFDFDDGGTYCGGWEDGKAHGHGVCTGPKSQGEYSGSWHFGFEVSGVYTWPSGSTYDGQWQNGKRHGLGVESRGRWTYRGEWTQGFKGRYGVRQSASSAARYEGTWANGLQDGYGSETYADGGTFQGQWMRGMRHGYGVRSSAAFGSASQPRLAKGGGGSLSSLQDDAAADRDRRMDDCRGGFVLKSRSDEPPPRRRSLVERSTNLKKSILQGLKIKKQRSTGDIDRRGASSVRSSGSNLSSASSESSHSGLVASSVHTDSNGSFVSQDELCDTAVTETYLGEWKNDRRCGFGIAERSDGLKYEGEWYNNKKYGYGVTTLKDGAREEGKYKNNVLVSSGKKKHLFMLRSAKFKERVEAAVNAAARASQIALQKADIAISRTATSRGKAEQADIAAIHAHEDANLARHIAKQFDPDVKLPDMLKSSNPRLSVRVPFANLSNQRSDSPANLSSRTESPMDPRMVAPRGPYAPPPPQPHLDRFATPQQSHQYMQQQQMPYGQPYANQTTQGYPPKPPQPMLQPQYYPPQDPLQGYPSQQQQQANAQQYPAPKYLGGGDPPVVPNRQGSFRRRPSYSMQQAMGDHFDHYRQQQQQELRPRNVIKHGRRIPSPARSGIGSRETPPSLLYRGGGPDATPDSGVSESMDGDESPARFSSSLLSFAPSEEDGSVMSRSPTASEVGADPAFPRTASLYVNPPSRRKEAAAVASSRGGGGGGGGEAMRRKKSMPHGPKETAAVPQRVIPREEVAFLSSQRREEVRRIQYESDRLRSNPLLYLVRPDLKEWFSRQQMILLVLFINISLAVMFYKLLS